MRYLVFKLSLVTAKGHDEVQENEFVKSFSTEEDATNFIAKHISDLDVEGFINKSDRKDDEWKNGEYSSEYATKEIYELDINCDDFDDIDEIVLIYYILRED